MPSGYHYAVAKGRKPGIYDNWDECKSQVDGFKGARYKKFSSLEEAQKFISGEPNTADKKEQSSENGKRKHQYDEDDEEFFSQKKSKSVSSSTKSGEVEKIWVDGSCVNNGKPDAYAGVGVFFGDDDPRNVSERLQGLLQTNQRAELMAAIRGLQTSKSDHIEIITDSMYTINCVTTWIDAWIANGWRNSQNQNVKNRDLIEILYNLTKQVKNLKWTHVKGHSGVYGNEMADVLASKGGRKKLTNL